LSLLRQMRNLSVSLEVCWCLFPVHQFLSLLFKITRWNGGSKIDLNLKKIWILMLFWDITNNCKEISTICFALLCFVLFCFVLFEIGSSYVLLELMILLLQSPKRWNYSWKLPCPAGNTYFHLLIRKSEVSLIHLPPTVSNYCCSYYQAA
jgi:hypothetical protein